MKGLPLWLIAAGPRVLAHVAGAAIVLLLLAGLIDPEVADACLQGLGLRLSGL